VSDKQSRPPLRQSPQGADDGTFVLFVESRRWLVQNQDRCVANCSPSDGDPLPLAVRQRYTAFAENRVVTLRQAFDELVGIRQARGCFDLLLSSTTPRITDVVANRRCE